MRLRNKSTKNTKQLLVAAAVAVVGLGGLASPLAAHAMQNNGHDVTRLNSSMHEYVAYLHPLNHTNVTGMAKFEQSGNHLKATIYATGLEKGIHPQHIHGKDQAAAECPTTSADLNHDGFISVIEGAPSYGLIKMNLTNPQTPFGAPPTLALFKPFAGTANNANFPVVGSDGVLNFTSNYTFDSSAAAQQALASLTPFGDQELVLHGATAPKSVDADAFAALGKAYPAGTDLSVKAYDALLPAACGEIDEASTAPTTGSTASTLSDNLATVQSQLTDGLTVASANAADANSFNEQVSNLSTSFNTTLQRAVTTYQTSISNGANQGEARNQLINTLSSAKDSELNQLTEARNQLIDQLNQAGNVDARDAFLNGFDATVNQYRNVLEQAKNQL